MGDQTYGINKFEPWSPLDRNSLSRIFPVGKISRLTAEFGRRKEFEFATFKPSSSGVSMKNFHRKLFENLSNF